MNCTGCQKLIGWLNWDGRCFGCHMYGDDRLTKKPAKPEPVTKPKPPVALDLFAAAGE